MNHDGHISRDCHEDGAAFVLGAMQPGEAAEYRRHVSGCRACRAELAAFASVVDALAMATPQYAVPADLRRRVLRSARSELRAEPARAEKPGRRPGIRAEKPARRRPGIRAGLALAAAAAVIALTVAVAGVTGGSGGSRLIQATVADSPGTAQLRIGGGQAELIVRHLRPPAAGRIYEVWLKRPDHPPAPTSALFSVTADGGAEVGVPGNLHDVVDILVTEERAGGSRVSIHAPLIVAPTS
jgi:anti-sigma factor RsiW